MKKDREGAACVSSQGNPSPLAASLQNYADENSLVVRNPAADAAPVASAIGTRTFSTRG